MQNWKEEEGWEREREREKSISIYKLGSDVRKFLSEKKKMQYKFPSEMDKGIYITYRALHRLGQAKIANSGLVLGSSRFLILPQLPYDGWFKSGQNRLENNHLTSLI